MGVLLDSWLLELLVVTGGLFLAIYWYLTSTFDYWKLKGVPYLEPTPLVGNMKDAFLMRRCQHEVFNDIYQKFERHRYCGLYQFKQPEFMVRDPELVKNVLVKDFSNFQDRLKNIDLTHNRIFENLFVLGAPKWRPLRVMLSPTFTSGKLKAMFGSLARCAENLNVSLKTSANKSEELDMKEVSSNFTTDVIGSCTFGLQVDSVVNPHNKFREFSRKMVSLSLSQMLSCFLLFFIPYLGRILKVKIIDGKSADFFKKVVIDAIEYRQKNNIKRNDFLQLIMELKEKGKVEFEKDLSKEDSYLKNHLTEDFDHKEEDSLEFTDDLLLAQCLIFFTAGFETSSWTMSFCLHELAVNPDIQQKLREEIDKVLEDHGGELTYDAVQSMTYLGMVVDGQ
uniref:Cytochrome P450 n=1 Tax=Timema cristinae TaxID=61476 RepID=A0A7R9DQY9_TIMCR|nr:unnamed protein product [Timema cristinae]